MLGRTYDDQVCSLARTLEVVGERWTLLIVRDALLGLRRFAEFAGSLGLARTVLTERLSTLVDAGVLERVRYQRRPDRFEYRLTERGQGLALGVLALTQWGDAHRAGPAGPPRVARHTDCGGEVVAVARCERCGGHPGAGEVGLVPGPGFGTSTGDGLPSASDGLPSASDGLPSASDGLPSAGGGRPDVGG